MDVNVWIFHWPMTVEGARHEGITVTAGRAGGVKGRETSTLIYLFRVVFTLVNKRLDTLAAVRRVAQPPGQFNDDYISLKNE